MKKMIAAMFLGVMVCGTAQAGTLNKADVGAGAKWLFHFDWEKYHTSDMYALISTTPAHAKAQANIASATAMLGFNPLEDISSITAYGTDFKQGQGAVIIKGRMVPEKATALLEKNKTHEVESYGAYTIHTWIDMHGRHGRHGKKGACSFYDNGTVILCKEADAVKAAIDVLDAKTASLETSTDGIAIPDVSPDVFLMAYADKCEGAVAQNPKAQIFRNVDSLTFAAAESDGIMIAEAELGAGSTEKAELIRNAISGMLSFAMLSAADDPVMVDMINTLKINTDGAMVKVSFSKKSSDLMDVVKTQMEKRQKRFSTSNKTQPPAAK